MFVIFNWIGLEMEGRNRIVLHILREYKQSAFKLLLPLSVIIIQFIFHPLFEDKYVFFFGRILKTNIYMYTLILSKSV